MRLIPIAFVFLLTIGCSSSEEPAASITLATTTSTRDTGLLDVLVPRFEQQTGVEVKVVAVGSEQALELGRRGDADVLLTHAPDAEKQFIADGHGVERRLVMHNDFVLVGPESDPAGVSGENSILAAFAKVAQSQSPFISRGDESGTHMKEKKVWSRAGLAPGEERYIRSGSGMAQTLRMASEKEGYTLSDRGTFLSQRAQLNLVIVSQGDLMLRNQYAVIAVNPQVHRHVNADGAQQFIDFLLSPEVQATIGRFGVEKFGEPLFFPAAAVAGLARVQTTSRCGPRPG